MSKLRQHVLLSIATSNATMLIGFVAALFLARLLTPEEIGVFSVAYAFAGLLRTLREMGLGAYIVQEPDLTDDRYRTALGISITLSVVLGLALTMLAPFAAAFYREPRLAPALYVIAWGFVLVPIGASAMSYLRRNLQVQQISIIDTLSALAQSGSAVLLAWLGYSYMSLAWSSLIGILATILSVSYFRPAGLPWLPSLREWRRVLRFSSFVSASAIVNYINSVCGDLILGRTLNMVAVAILNRASGLCDLLEPIIARAGNVVGLPHFSATSRAGGALGPGFVQGTGIIAMVALPFYAVMALTAEPLVLFLFGEQWQESGHLLQILCLAAMLRVPMMLATPVMTGLGAVSRLFSLDAQCLLLKLVIMLYCATIDLETVAWGYCLSTLLAVVLRLKVLHELLGFRWTELLLAMRHAIWTSLAAACGPLFIVPALAGYPAYLIVGIAGACATIGWLLSVMLGDSPLRKELAPLLGRWRNRGAPPE